MWSWSLTMLPQMTPGPKVPGSGTRRRSEEPKKWSSWEWWRKLTPTLWCAYVLICFSSVQALSYIRLFVTPWTAAMTGLPVHHQLPESTQTHVNQVGDAIQPSHPLLSPSPPALNLSQHQGFFPMSQVFASGGQSTGVSASSSVLSKNVQDWFPLQWTGWFSLQSKGLLRVFSNTTVQKHQFFGAQLSL